VPWIDFIERRCQGRENTDRQACRRCAVERICDQFYLFIVNARHSAMMAALVVILQSRVFCWLATLSGRRR
jgi:hypothetical protein